MRDLSDYAFLNARVRAMKSRFLSPDQWETVIQSRSLSDAITNLGGTAYAPFIREDVVRDKGLAFIESELIRHDIRTHRQIINNTHEKSRIRNVIELSRERYEIDEIKALLRRCNDQSGGQEDALMEAFVHPVNIDRVLQARDDDELAAALHGTAYQRVLLNEQTKGRGTGPLFYIESAMDIDYFKRLWQEIDRLPSSDRRIASRLVGIEVDIENICALVRLQQYYDLSSVDLTGIMLPGGSMVDERVMGLFMRKEGLSDIAGKLRMRPYQDLAVLFSKEMDRSSMPLLEGGLYHILYEEAHRAMVGFPFTIGTILGYIILKRAETRKIISILNAKEYGLHPDRINEALRC